MYSSRGFERAEGYGRDSSLAPSNAAKRTSISRVLGGFYSFPRLTRGSGISIMASASSQQISDRTHVRVGKERVENVRELLRRGTKLSFTADTTSFRSYRWRVRLFQDIILESPTTGTWSNSNGVFE